jgi:CBS domain-containing protein
MVAANKPFLSLTANDLMSREVEAIPRAMSLRAAAHLLSQAHITGAPVVDTDGKCVGVLSATDFVRWAEEPGHPAATPGCFHSAWQMMDFDVLPAEEVSGYMTADPIMVPPSTKIADLAQMMLDAHIHRIIVVDQQHRPLGIVSTTDIVAAVAQFGRSGEGVVRAPRVHDSFPYDAMTP